MPPKTATADPSSANAGETRSAPGATRTSPPAALRIATRASHALVISTAADLGGAAVSNQSLCGESVDERIDGGREIPVGDLELPPHDVVDFGGGRSLGDQVPQ